jgi:heme/copper-type cytochrome/quinol oxidase subunit 3
MEENQATLDTLKDIKSLMERSSRFISLSGLSGVFSGTLALIGAYLAHWKTNQGPWIQRAQDTDFGTGEIVSIDWSVVWFLAIDALLVFILSMFVGYYFSRQKALRKGQPLWGTYSKQFLINLSLPLVTGGIFCMILFYHGLIGLIAPASLVFYGLALLNGGKFSFEEISYLGMSEIALGLAGLVFKGQGLFFWAIGFGVLHIVYGILMYIRHDR